MWCSGVAVVMVALEFLEVGMNTVNKVAMSQGLSQYVLVAYSNVLAIFLLLFSSLIFYRKGTIPPLTCSITGRIFVLSLLSCSGQVYTYIGLEYSSPTLASAMTDLTPAFTVILAIISRMETVDLRNRSSQAKSFGTVALITGGLVVTLCKGLPLISTSSASKLVNQLVLSFPSNWAIGGFFLAAHSFVLALMYIILTWIMKDYPAEMMITLINSIFVSILSTIVSFVVEKDSNAWRIRPGIELIAIGYSAFLAVSLRTIVHTWACHKKGPVYTSLFKPLGMVIAAFMGVSLMGDTLYLGSVIGAVIIAIGFYAVTWGKSQEEKIVDNMENDVYGLSFPKIPLLQNKNDENV